MLQCVRKGKAREIKWPASDGPTLWWWRRHCSTSPLLPASICPAALESLWILVLQVHLRSFVIITLWSLPRNLLVPHSWRSCPSVLSFLAYLNTDKPRARKESRDFLIGWNNGFLNLLCRDLAIALSSLQFSPKKQHRQTLQWADVSEILKGWE